MRAPQNSQGEFEKVGECLYRYLPTGGYYARIKTNGKEIRRSLETTDREIAKEHLTIGCVDLTSAAPALLTGFHFH